METTQKKNSWKRKGLTLTPGVHSDLMTSRMTTSRLESISSHSSFVKNIPNKNENQDSQDKAIAEYEREYLLYLLRVLQKKKFIEEGNEKEKEARKCLVSLKKEYEDLVKENVSLFEEYQNVKLHGTAIEILDGKLEMARPIAMFLKKKQFYSVLENVYQYLRGETSKLHLVDLKKEDIEKAFHESFLGFNSNIYKLVNRLSEYSKGHKDFLPEIVELLKDIQNGNAVNENLRKRCLTIVAEIQSCRIKCTYKKYFGMALEECKDILEESHETNDNVLNERSCLGVPSSSSTPN